MAAGWSVMDALNKNSKAAAEEKPKARFRTRDISIRKIYSNDRNFYSMPGIEQLARDLGGWSDGEYDSGICAV